MVAGLTADQAAARAVVAAVEARPLNSARPRVANRERCPQVVRQRV